MALLLFEEVAVVALFAAAADAVELELMGDPIVLPPGG